MQFLVITRDGDDAGAPARRQKARPAHLEGAGRLTAEGTIQIGGAILDDAGRMVGSAVVYDVPDRAALDAIMAADPYVTQGVWQHIDIRPFRTAVQSKPKA